jgi:hypothetical protein
MELKLYWIECCDGEVQYAWATNLGDAWSQACDMGLEVDAIRDGQLAYQVDRWLPFPPVLL